MSARTKAESDFSRLERATGERIVEANSYHIKKHQSLEVINRELGEKLSKKNEELKRADNKTKEQQAAITRAKACLNDL